jgi:hypothetical protein
MEKFASLDKERSQRLRARYDGALSANAALQNLLKREAGKHDAMKLMGSENFHTVTTGERDFTRDDALWVYLNGQGENYSLRDVSLSEDMFVRAEVSAEETFKIEGLPLHTRFFGGTRTRTTKTKVGLYQISSSMEEWAEDLLDRLKQERDRKGRSLKPQEIAPIFLANPEWVNDDTGLIGKCHTKTANANIRESVALVSNDKKLANKMANTCNVDVIRLDPQQFVREATARGLTVSHDTDPSFLKELGVMEELVLLDTGSIAASATNMVEERGHFYDRSVRHTGWDGDTRVSHITLAKVKRTRLRKSIHRPQTRPRIWRQTSRPQESVYSSHESWKTSRTSRSGSSNWWRSGTPPPMPARSVYNVPGAYPDSPTKGLQV